MFLKTLYKTILGFILLLLSGNLYALCAGLGCTCSISVPTLNFSTYAPLSGSADNVTDTVSVTCSALVLSVAVSYTITLSQGGSGTYTQRQMTNGGATLNYNIYTDSGRTLIWGNGAGGTSDITDSYTLVSSPTTKNYTAYGQIPANQTSAIPGSYSDSIVATVTF